ncbi:molybdopterin-guanine dinucleotide biosynthesis protein [Mobiluncus curtisii]|jgi:hypothetical protein|uniref:DUF6457 domain-containing protein n=2 Tax=Mobiluncus curtisii TaxID=2051 RepID=E6LYK8_9ACTO|nr:hypothetical protein HMPREF0388_0945 [Mobiluncus curtisii ATCC 51333]MCV0021682.1 molybdopterin-guanine dinucleotide biosynthesis protein [Mobiluncus curtisii]NMW46204.1 molybdopterin-guanine dinucleotide biosynthesis protein [Mobiluncus curtisii]NMW47205.1 molybdopterin-guanine dinucleotide biosynthesis protein [Mobiluncus curtisii]
MLKGASQKARHVFNHTQRGADMATENRKDDPEKMAKMAAWLQAASRELQLPGETIVPIQEELLNLISEVAHGPSRPGAPLTAFLVGYAAGGDIEKAAANVAKLRDLVAQYPAD